LIPKMDLLYKYFVGGYIMLETHFKFRSFIGPVLKTALPRVAPRNQLL